MNRLIRNPIVVTAVFAGIFILLIESGSSAARLAGTGVLLTAILAMSVMAVTKMIRRRRLAPYAQDAVLPAKIRRWVFDEPDDPETQPETRSRL